MIQVLENCVFFQMLKATVWGWVEYRTYKAQAEHPQGATGMEQQADAEHIHMDDADNQVVDEVSNSQRLNQATGTSVSKDTLTSRHFIALCINEHNPQCSNVDKNTLNQRNDMDIPVESSPSIQLGIVVREEDRRQPWRQDRVDELVKGEGENHFMDVLGEGWTAQAESERLGEAPQPCWRRPEGVEHRGDADDQLITDVGSSDGRG